MGGILGGGSQNVTQVTRPWAPSTPLGKAGIQDAMRLFRQDRLVPEPRQSGATQDYIAGLEALGSNNAVTNTAVSGWQDFMKTGPANLDGVYDYTASKVLPQVAGMFGQGGFANSTTAQQTAADALTNAFAPIALQQRNTEDSMRLQGLGLAPTIGGLQAADLGLVGQAGQLRDQFSMQKRGNDAANQEAAARLFQLYGGMGGSSAGSQQQNPGLFDILGGVGQTGANAALAYSLLCDERLKTDIQPTGLRFRDVALYVFRYLWDAPETRRIGSMAQEVPDRARVTLPGGWLAVNMGAL